jgi:pyruvate/2-oxoglutarate dehydrogenase complex dihydrolipoamide acyltransferase (E2) component
MLHSINEVCELTGRSRSSIYRMFGRGDLAYMVGKDGKRRVETSELLRVFDEINFNDSPTLSEPPEAAQRTQPQGPDPYITARELTDLRGMIHELRDELDDLREDNRRLLRLLEYQATPPQPPSPPAASAAPESVSPAPENQSEHQSEYQPERQPEPKPEARPVVEPEVDPLDEEEPVPVTSVAERGWRAYRQQRAEQEQQRRMPAPFTSAPSSTEPGMLNELGVWLKGFFLGEWQKR